MKNSLKWLLQEATATTFGITQQDFSFVLSSGKRPLRPDKTGTGVDQVILALIFRCGVILV